MRPGTASTSTSTAKRRRLPRFSAPNVNARSSGAPNPDVHTLVDVDRFRRGSTGSAYVPGDLAKELKDPAFIADEDEPDYEFPTWWFFVIPSQFYLVWVFETCLWGIVFPDTLAEMYGDRDKAFVLATTGTIGTVMGFFGPFTGSLSDRLPEMFPDFSRRWGRRRPLYWIGQVVGMTSIVFTKTACMNGPPHNTHTHNTHTAHTHRKYPLVSRHISHLSPLADSLSSLITPLICPACSASASTGLPFAQFTSNTSHRATSGRLAANPACIPGCSK